MTDAAIKLDGANKRYRYFTFDNIDLHVPAGEIMGLIGPNGPGKSTTIRILLGLVHQDSGNVQVLGHHMPAEQVDKVGYRFRLRGQERRTSFRRRLFPAVHR
jgi:ABC-2 type transport system ATP-binding protein